MCQQGAVSFCLNVLQGRYQVHGRIETGSFHQQILPVTFAEWEQVTGFQTLFKEIVHHVFSGQIQFHRTTVGGLQLLEFLLQGKSGIGDIFHHMRSEPHLADALAFHLMQDYE